MNRTDAMVELSAGKSLKNFNVRNATYQKQDDFVIENITCNGKTESVKEQFFEWQKRIEKLSYFNKGWSVV